MSNCDTERLFKLQGFAESDVTSGHFAAPEISYNTTSDNITIPSSDLTGSNGEALYFRIIAIDDNNTICSSQESIRTFYQFNGECVGKLTSVPYSFNKVCYRMILIFCTSFDR